MSTAKQRGFTIIEVTLFIAISGLLAVLLMTGWATRVNTERYRDSIVTLQSFLQQQYNLVYNVENERSGDLQCNSNAEVPDETPAGSAEARGQSNCVLLGRFISVKTDSGGTNLSVVPIIGYEGAVSATSADSLPRLLHDDYKASKLENVDMGLSDAELFVPWGATINDSDKGDGTKRSFAKNFNIAIIRSPLNGTAHTYIATENSLERVLGINGSNVDDTEREAKMCLDPGALFSGGSMAVVIRAHASSQNAVATEAGC